MHSESRIHPVFGKIFRLFEVNAQANSHVPNKSQHGILSGSMTIQICPSPEAKLPFDMDMNINRDE